MATVNTARLKAAGPIDPAHGFPLWFEDGNGVRLELGLTPDARTPAIGDRPRPTEALSFPDNFPDEAFYFMAEARLPVGGNGVTGRARVILALEAAFGGAGEPGPGLNVVFARIRVDMDDVVPGAAYVVTHPYGVTDPLSADDRGRVRHTLDLGIIEGDPTGVVTRGQVAPFLQSVSAEPGYLGDGVTETQVTGSPIQLNGQPVNYVSILGPGIREGGGLPDPADAANLDRVWTDRFSVQGRLATRQGAWLEGASYAPDGAGALLRVVARSGAGQDLRVGGNGVHFKLNADGERYAGIGIGSAAQLPTDARLFNLSDVPATSYPIHFTDQVVVTRALYDAAAQTLTVQASSSDPAAALSLPQFGDQALGASPHVVAGVTAPPAVLVVASSLGGQGVQQVELTGPAVAGQPVQAVIAVVTAAMTGDTVVLDGSGSPGATGYNWAQLAGPGVAIDQPTAAVTHFVPTAAGSYQFRLDVTGSGGPASADTSAIAVTAAPTSDNVVVTRCEYRTGRRQFRVEGTVDNLPNTIQVRFGGTELGQATPDATGAWAVRRTLLDNEAGTLPTPGASVHVASRRTAGEHTLRIRQ